MNILFVCKYNRFRSRIAELYLKKINKNNLINIKSAGIIQGEMPFNKKEIVLSKEIGININGKIKCLKFRDISWADLIIIVANNVPISLFKSKRFEKKVVVWNIPDVYPDSKEEFIRKVIFKIKRTFKN